jgi:hypothetical protein
MVLLLLCILLYLFAKIRLIIRKLKRSVLLKFLLQIKNNTLLIGISTQKVSVMLYIFPVFFHSQMCQHQAHIYSISK